MYSPMSELLPLNQARALHSLQSIAQLAGPLVVLSIYYLSCQGNIFKLLEKTKIRKYEVHHMH